MDQDAVCVCVSLRLLCTLWYHVSVAGANRYSTIRSNHVPTTPLDPPWILTNILAKQSPLFVSLDIHAGKITHVNIALLSSIEACNKLYDLFIIYIPIYIYYQLQSYIYTISCNHIYICYVSIIFKFDIHIYIIYIVLRMKFTLALAQHHGHRISAIPTQWSAQRTAAAGPAAAGGTTAALGAEAGGDWDSKRVPRFLIGKYLNH